MKKRVLFLTVLLVLTMVFVGTLLAESNPVVHLIEGDNVAGGCFETATTAGGAIPDNTPAGICFDLNLGGGTATVTGVSVDVAATHTWIGDLEFWLISPDASTLYMLDRPAYAGQAPGCCGDSSDLIASSVINFTDGNTYNAETMGGTIGATEFVCQTDGECDFYPNPDGATGLSNFAGFVGETVSGTWQFCAADNVGADTGSISSATVNVSCAAPPAPAIALTKTVGTDPNACATTDSITIPAGGGGSDVTYCYYMTNTGTVTFTTHNVVDTELGPLLIDYAAIVGPGESAWFTATTLITQTTVNTATWTASVPNPQVVGGQSASATDTATVTVGAPTDVSLSSFGSEQAALSPVWLATLLAVILGFGFVLRRKMANN